VGLLVKANAKINLSLKIGEKKEGLHYIDSVMQNISVSDFLEFEDSTKSEVYGEVLFHQEDNLIVKAYKKMQELTDSKLPCKITFHKTIPSSSGLGGGSADAAATLVGLNEFFCLCAGGSKILEIGKELGSDVPFFLKGGKCRVTGTGDVVKSLPFEPANVIVARPHVRLSTRKMYDELDKVSGTGEHNNDFEVLMRLPEYAWTVWLFKQARKFDCQPLLSGKGPSVVIMGENQDQVLKFLTEADFNGDIYTCNFVDKGIEIIG